MFKRFRQLRRNYLRMEDPRLHYRPLEKDTQEIRVLTLQPAIDFGSPLRGTLRHERLGDATYSALSYVWGDQVANASYLEVAYEGAGVQKEPKTFQFKIGENLANALKHIRRPINALTIWVDAICIDQGNDKEKSWQVQLMGDIYSRATMVEVWLGPEPKLSSSDKEAVAVALYLIKRLGTLLDSFSENWVPNWKSIWREIAPQDYWQPVPDVRDYPDNALPLLWAVREALGDKDDHIVFLKTMQTLSSCTWWSRVWIIQEYARAREIRFRFEKFMVSGRHLSLVAEFAYALHSSHALDAGSSFHPDPQFKINSILNAPKYAQSGLPFLLMNLFLNEESVPGATDPRDLVFALLGLVDKQLGLYPDYSSTLEDVYIKTAMTLISNGYPDHLTCSNAEISLLKIPSWAFDFSKGLPSNRNRLEFTDKNSDVLGTDVLATFEQSKLLQSTILLLNGVQRGTISKLAPAGADSEGLFSERSDELRIEAAKLGKILGMRVDYTEKEPMIQSIPYLEGWFWWKTWVSLIFEFVQIHGRAHSDKLATFQSLLFPRNAPENSFTRVTSLAALLGQRAGKDDYLQLDKWVKVCEEEKMKMPHACLAIRAFCQNMRLVALDSGYVGYACDNAKEGDQIVSFGGVLAPLIIRKVKDDNFTIVGPAIFYGAMADQFSASRPPWQTFRLI